MSLACSSIPYTSSWHLNSVSGHVGPPLPCNIVKLVDVAEMNYLAANGEGEVSLLLYYLLCNPLTTRRHYCLCSTLKGEGSLL